MSVLIRGVGSLGFTLKILFFFHNSMLIKLQMYQNCQPYFFWGGGGGNNLVRDPYVFKTHLIKPSLTKMLHTFWAYCWEYFAHNLHVCNLLFHDNLHMCKIQNRAYSEGRTEAGYIFFVLWERFFLYGYQRDLGRVSVSKCFHSCSTGGTLDWDS